ncbi:fungal-specific transcription factor domain-containing protein, partial [Cryomyces antarcticus]
MDSMSDVSSLSDTQRPQLQSQLQTQKRKATAAGINPNPTRPTKSVVRRASKACQCCRSRKVRCNVMQHGAPCMNCRLDEVECVVSASKRKKKWTEMDDNETNFGASHSCVSYRAHESQDTLDGVPSIAPLRPLSRSGRRSEEASSTLSTFPVSGRSTSRSPRVIENQNSFAPVAGPPEPVVPTPPHFIKPHPQQIGTDEIFYLNRKGALTLPDLGLRNELLRSYAEYVHPFMPLLDLQDFLEAVEGNGNFVSLLLFQCVMFAGTAFVDLRHLKNEGYATRREARKQFFRKTRLLYDFDFEVDGVSLIQSLLLMTYWYETPDDQKDGHHWMGVAVSLSHTIGLHRNPENSRMDVKRRSLWKRIWWSTFMQDRLIALETRRPMRIKCEDFDVPMLTLEDFDISPLPDHISCIPVDCTLLRDEEKQRQLAIMCIEKAKLCLCISHVLSTQYSVLSNDQGALGEEGHTKTTVILQPKKLGPETCRVKTINEELQRWEGLLPEEAQYRVPSRQDIVKGNGAVVLHSALLQMVYFATLSALHRPQVLPSAAWPVRNVASDLLDISRRSVRRAANEITNIAQDLSILDLVHYLPTTGVTVLLPAIIIHLLDIKAPDEATRRASLHGFCQCMQAVGKLRETYAAADYATTFLETTIRKAGISMSQQPNASRQELATTAEGLVDADRWMDFVPVGPNPRTLTSPPEGTDELSEISDYDVA